MAFRKIRLFYYNNKNKIWKVIGLIALVIVIISILNQIARRDISDNIENTVSTNQYINNISSIYNPTQSVVDNGQVSALEEEDINSILTNFLDYCTNQNPEQAYNLLSEDCKEVYYPTYQMFYTNYYEPIFSEPKTYTYQLWTSSGEYVFLVKIMDNALDTGKISDEIVQDYITIVRQNGKYLLNINSFIKREEINQNTSGSGVQITLQNVDYYMDNLVCSYIINNQSQNNIMLTDENQEGIYIVDRNGIQYDANINEMNPNDLIINANTTKQIKIIYNCGYVSDKSISSFIFENIVTNYEEYQNMENKQEYTGFLNLEI